MERLTYASVGINISSLHESTFSMHLKIKKLLVNEKLLVVQVERLELSSLAALVPDTSVSTNSTTPAKTYFHEGTLNLTPIKLLYITCLPPDSYGIASGPPQLRKEAQFTQFLCFFK